MSFVFLFKNPENEVDIFISEIMICDINCLINKSTKKICLFVAKQKKN
jgi:hypothetical protein